MAMVEYTIQTEMFHEPKDFEVETEEQILEKIKEYIKEDPSYVLDGLDRFVSIECNLKKEEKEKK